MYHFFRSPTADGTKGTVPFVPPSISACVGWDISGILNCIAVSRWKVIWGQCPEDLVSVVKDGIFDLGSVVRAGIFGLVSVVKDGTRMRLRC